MAKNDRQNRLYVRVILPLKLSGGITYSVPQEFGSTLVRGSKVVVSLINRKYIAIVDSISDSPDFDPEKIRSISYKIDEPPISVLLIDFWKRLADYYMCSIGEVYKAASSSVSYHNISRKREEEDPDSAPVIKQAKKIAVGEESLTDSSLEIFNKNLPELSESQFEALNRINRECEKKRVVLLNGVTGSGKSEIYFHLIADQLDKGRDVLYMLPEIAVSRDIARRLSKVFCERVFIYHSGQTPSKKRSIVELLNRPVSEREPIVILGLRSSVFLPLENTGLIIVDEEHDTSYKQSDPAPRYNGRDAAMLLSSLTGTNVLLGSATPSFESLYNVKQGKYSEILLTRRYHQAPDPCIKIIDMQRERKKRAVKGSLSLELIKAIEERISNGEQTLIFRSRRAYSPVVQCSSCGFIPKCPQCNIHLSYHKFDNSLSCHYCGYRIGMNPICSQCTESMTLLGAGTERIEEELRELFKQAMVARFDADTARDGKEQEKILKEFASGKIDILVGTQMISKGFDFKRLTLVAVIQGETISSSSDFRSDEKALQLIIQLMGRAGRRMQQGEIIIQTSRPDHLLFHHLNPNNNEQSGEKSAIQNIADTLLAQREEFKYPPYVRVIKLTIKDRDPERCRKVASSVRDILNSLKTEFNGPVPPPIEKINNEYLLQFWVKLPRSRQSEIIKQLIYRGIESLLKTTFSTTSIVIDVDPLQ